MNTHDNLSTNNASSSRTLCLTPECQKLWAIRPGLCFLYDQIVIDTQDYHDILNQQDDSTYNTILARNIERLRMEGILNLISFASLIAQDVRNAIHHKASSYIDSMSMNRRVQLATFGHGEYAEYLKGQILFCRTDEPKFAVLTERMTRVKQRINSMTLDRRTTPEIDTSMKRVVAKSLAGSYIASQLGDVNLYDTSEYRPFISGFEVDDEQFRNARNRLHDNSEDVAIDVIAAIIFNKSLPDVTVYDDHTLTKFLKTREEMTRLKCILEDLLCRYRELLAADPDVALAHLRQRFARARSILDQELGIIKKRTGLLWKVTEILASLKLPILQPLLEPLRKKNMEKHREMQVARLGRKDKLIGGILFVFDHIRFGKTAYPIESRRHYRIPKESTRPLWGDWSEQIPWYERPE